MSITSSDLKERNNFGHCSSVSSVIRVRGTISQPNNLPTELEKLVAISSKDIKPAQQPKLRDLVKKVPRHLRHRTRKRGRTNLGQHKIDTGVPDRSGNQQEDFLCQDGRG
ncbi:hypothetical protein JTB14_034568 [Gonioctena quinquepunctata]|nr:hypothetical protein JTB14_034568 [Gonioctena quinquepunctata]